MRRLRELERAGKPTPHGARGYGRSARIAAFLAVLCTLVWPLPSQAGIGVAETVVHEVFGNSLNRRMRAGEELDANQRVRTLSESAANLTFNDGTRLAIGPGTEIRLDEFVYDPDAAKTSGALRLVKGLLRFASQKNRVDMQIKTPSAVIGIRGTAFDLMVDRRQTEIAVHDGVVEAVTAAGSQLVRAGDVIRIEAGQTPTAPAGLSQQMAAAIADMTALLPNVRDMLASLATPGERQAAIPPWRAAVKGRDPENLLLMDLSYGSVLIELRPDLSPHHAARLRELVRAGFYDGLGFHHVTHNFVAETGDPASAGRTVEAVGTIAAELTPTAFRRGSVGMKHDRGDPDSATTQFFILYRTASHLDGKYTYVGDVVYGLLHLEQLQEGSPPPNPDYIVRLRVLADVLKEK